ncbi:MAG: hypothetical protein KDA93_13010 [Planctomycetaceae bacterium]|nr:hypothetical protein [Planctomycetaceae bacterium]
MGDPSDTTRPDAKPFGWEYFRFVVAALLMAAAVVKFLNMAQIMTGGGLLGTMPRLVAVTAFEAAAAVYLIVGNRRLSWLLTLTTFTIFAASTVYAMATNQSCNCFGTQLNPERMVVLDTVVLLLTALLRPLGVRVSSQNLIRHLTLVAVVGGLAAALAVWRYDVLLRQEQSRLLVVDVLVGKSWPVNGEMDPRLSELSSGKWMILMVDKNCVHCRDMVARYFADPETHRAGERTAVFVFGFDDDKWRFQFDRVTFDLSGEGLLNWPHGKPYVVNPAVFLLDDGIVVDAAEGTESDQFLLSILSSAEQATTQ